MIRLNLHGLQVHSLLDAGVVEPRVLDQAIIVESEHVDGVSQVLERSIVVLVALFAVHFLHLVLITILEAARHCGDIECLVVPMGPP